MLKLRLGADAAKVTLSTDNPGTNITDTVLYQLSSLAADAIACTESSCPCNDDAQGSALTRNSKLESNLKANKDYFIVVDSVPAPLYQPGGREFEVSISVE